MSVESFSQLPFIRSAPPLARDKGACGIRLFGQEFRTRKPSITHDRSHPNDEIREVDTKKDGGSDGSRKFECHYCCRNFPTSQALGGHQNAHKRERQQAKRAHLHSLMLHGGDPHHLYGLMNYTRLGSAPQLPPGYHSWIAGGGYGAVTAQPQPINGSPLTFWRVPAAAFAGRPTPPSVDEMMMMPLGSSVSNISGSNQFRFGYESNARMQDNVSLDLHL